MKYIIGLILLMVLVGFTDAFAHPNACAIKRDSHGRITRSQTAVNKFKDAAICPTTGAIARKCSGYVVDHIRPLCDCGADAPDNMQYQSLAESKIKDKFERQLCGGKGD